MIKNILIFSLNFYKKFITPILVNLFGYGCRFTPTCSQYASEAFSKYGLVVGAKLSLKRLMRCQPFYKGSY